MSRFVLPSAVTRLAYRIRARIHVRSDRRGSALILAMILTVALGGVAASAIYVGGNATMLATSMDRERDFKYASEAALAVGKSRLNYDPLAVPDTGYKQLLTNATITGADGKPIPNVTVNMYVGPTSTRTGQFGRFVSVVTEARDATGARFVRRLELTQESFAKFAYWTDMETNTSGTTIWFQNGDQLWGPVWSNDVIHVSNTNGAPTFWDNVGTAQYIDAVSGGIFKQGYSEHQKEIVLPSNTTLSSLPGYATAGGINFTAVTSGTTDGTRTRMEFVSPDLNGNAQPDDNEGFIKVYKAKAAGTAAWVRADWSNKMDNCGAWYVINAAGDKRFYSLNLHNQTFLTNLFKDANFRTWNPGITSTEQNTLKVPANYTQSGYITTVLEGTGTGRCYLGGAPQLAGVERLGYARWVDTATKYGGLKAYGGNDTTFTADGKYGTWQNWGGAIDPSVTAARRDAAQLFPMHRSLNTGTKGVIYVNGTVGISGTVRAHVTLYVSGNVAILDNIRYVADPSITNCKDILGVISAQNIMIADNSLNGPQQQSVWRNYGDTQDRYIQGVLMAIHTSFGVENYDDGPTSANGCEGKPVGRGCIYLLGGIIQDSRGAVGQSSGGNATGYVKRYSYDRCALYNPPPYFPTTGRYQDNRYYELDPNNFNVASLFASLTPTN